MVLYISTILLTAPLIFLKIWKTEIVKWKLYVIYNSLMRNGNGNLIGKYFTYSWWSERFECERVFFFLRVGVCLCVRIVDFKMEVHTRFYKRKWESSLGERKGTELGRRWMWIQKWNSFLRYCPCTCKAFDVVEERITDMGFHLELLNLSWICSSGFIIIRRAIRNWIFVIKFYLNYFFVWDYLYKKNDSDKNIKCNTRNSLKY